MCGVVVTPCFTKSDKLHGASTTADGAVIDVACHMGHYATLFHVVLVTHYAYVTEKVKITIKTVKYMQ